MRVDLIAPTTRPPLVGRGTATAGRGTEETATTRGRRTGRTTTSATRRGRRCWCHVGTGIFQVPLCHCLHTWLTSLTSRWGIASRHATLMWRMSSHTSAYSYDKTPNTQHRAYWGIGGYREGYRVRVYNRIATREPTSPWWGGEPIAKFSGTCTVIAFFFCIIYYLNLVVSPAVQVHYPNILIIQTSSSRPRRICLPPPSARRPHTQPTSQRTCLLTSFPTAKTR